MSNEHGSIVKSPKKLIIIGYASLCVLIFAVLLFALLTDNDQGAGAATKSTEQLIRPVAQLSFQDVSAPHEPLTGEQVYKTVCSSCHATGAAGAPKYGDTAAWSPRIAKGYDGLMTSVLKGKGAMPVRGGSSPSDISDYELGRAVVYMTAAAGGKFSEPKAPVAK